MAKLTETISQLDRPHVIIAMINGVGDGFLALPLIRYVMSLVGSERVTVWALPKFLRTCFAELGNSVLPTISENRKDASKKEREVAAIRQRIHADSTVCWVSLNSYSPLTGNEIYAITELRPRFFWGFDARGVRRIANDQPLFHRADQYFRVIGEEALPAHLSRRPALNTEAERFAKDFRSQARSLGKAVVAVHTETALEKQWPVQRWLKLGKLLEKYAELVLLGRQEQELSRCSAFVQPTVIWDEQVAILRNADAFVGIDSCFAHVADACDIPGAVLFGANPALRQWLPKGNSLTPILAQNGDLSELQSEMVKEVLLPHLHRYKAGESNRIGIVESLADRDLNS